MRVRPDHVRVHQRRTAPLAAVLDGRLHGFVGCQKIAAIHFLPKKPGETGYQRRNVRAGGLAFHRNRDGVAVILDQEQNRQAIQASRVQGFPKLALAGGAIAAGDQRDRVAIRLQIAIGLGASHGLQELRSGAGETSYDVVPRIAPVGGHLAAAGSRVVRRAHGLQQHFEGRHAQGQAQRPVAIVGKNPIVAGAQTHARRHFDRFVAGPADLEKDAVLALERDLAIIQAPRRLHDAEGADELLGLQPVPLGGGGLLGSGDCGQKRASLPLSV